MKILRTVSLVGILLALLTGCGANKVSLTKQDKQGLRSIAIVKIDKPFYHMTNKGSGAAAFGVIGALAASSDVVTLTGRLNKVVKKKRFNVNLEFEKQLKNELKRIGYKVHFIKLKRADKNKSFENFKNMKYRKADAILDVVVQSAGFSTEHFMMSPDWRPEIKAVVGLGKPGAHNLIYSETFMYGYHNPFMSGTDLDAPKNFMFDDEEDVFKGNGKVIIAGLKGAIKSIARQITEQLKK